MSKFEVGGKLVEFEDIDTLIEVDLTTKFNLEKIKNLLGLYGYEVALETCGLARSVCVWLGGGNFDVWDLKSDPKYKVSYNTLEAILEHQKSLEDTHE